ncbi:MAG: hypothetical protein MRZ36_07285 [Eubacterium sp.]|nr:hypothetical protein [Eubacterium sp.]
MSIIQTKELNLSYGKHHVLHDITMEIDKNEITALIGPSEKKRIRTVWWTAAASVHCQSDRAGTGNYPDG